MEMLQVHFIYTGFKPAFVLFKEYSGPEDWNIQDNERIGYNGKVMINYMLI